MTSVAKAVVGLICKEPLYRESLLSASAIVDHSELLIAVFTQYHSDGTGDGSSGGSGGGGGGDRGGGGGSGGGSFYGGVNGFDYPPAVVTTDSAASITNTTATGTGTGIPRYELTAEMDAAYNTLIRNAIPSFKTAGTIYTNN